MTKIRSCYFVAVASAWFALIVGVCLPQEVLADEPRASVKNEIERTQDISWLIDQIESHYAYLSSSGLDLGQLRHLYVPEAKAATTLAAWKHVVERLVAELHDHHAILGTNTPSSPQLIPSGTDLWGEIENDRAVVTAVRMNSPAMSAGLCPGDRIISIDGVPARKAIADGLPNTLDLRRAGDFTLQRLLAGVHDQVRRLVVSNSGDGRRRVVLPPFKPKVVEGTIQWHWLPHGIGYIRFNNSLGDYSTVAAVDSALVKLHYARGLVLDLRNTPSGGNTDVANPILGRFISNAGEYERFFTPKAGKSFDKNSTFWKVTPRGPFTFKAPMVVLVNRWTGSMGEGMATGLEDLHRAITVGTKMARLRGGTDDFILPHTHLKVDFPTYRVYRIDGEPREDFIPSVEVNLKNRCDFGDGDLILNRGSKRLQHMIEHAS